MRERLLIELRENNRRVYVDAASRFGVVLRGERDAFPRRVNMSLVPRGEPMKTRVRRLSQIKGWPLGEWRLNIWADGGLLALTGSEPDALLPGRYTLRTDIEDLRTVGRRNINVEIPEGGQCEVGINVRRDDRLVQLTDDVANFDRHVSRILTAEESVLDQAPAADWLNSRRPGSVRQACLLNVLAMTRATPTKRDHLARHVLSVFFAATDRVYATVKPTFLARLESLAVNPRKRFFREGEPKGGVHARLLDRIVDDRRVQPDTYRLISFRAEGAPSLQAVVAFPKDGQQSAYHYVDLDLDLGNPLQDVVGFLIHMGELLNPGRTDHFRLRRKLEKGRAGEFLYYRIANRSERGEADAE